MFFIQTKMWNTKDSVQKLKLRIMQNDYFVSLSLNLVMRIKCISAHFKQVRSHEFRCAISLFDINKKRNDMS